MNLVLVPPWVDQAMTAAGQSINELFNTEVLQSTLSSEDVNFYIFLNQALNQLIPPEVVASFESGNSIALGIAPEVLESLQDGIMVYSVPPAPFKSQWLFGPLSDTTPLEKITYKVMPIHSDTLILIPQLEGGLSIIGMVNELLYHLNGRLTMSELAQTTIFRYYLVNA